MILLDENFNIDDIGYSVITENIHYNLGWGLHEPSYVNVRIKNKKIIKGKIDNLDYYIKSAEQDKKKAYSSKDISLKNVLTKGLYSKEEIQEAIDGMKRNKKELEKILKTL